MLRVMTLLARHQLRRRPLGCYLSARRVAVVVWFLDRTVVGVFETSVSWAAGS